jgi:coenzyme F420-0:L-glutamate ligase/coenzyme F420-1:gamma-L-glutamate ligase
MSPGAGNSESKLPVIAILGGTGKEGTGLALRWAVAGYKVIIGSRQSDRAESIAMKINQQLAIDIVIGLENNEAARLADIIVLTISHTAHDEFIRSISGILYGKILVDATSRVDYKDPKPPEAPSAGLRAQEILGPEVRVVAGFQNIPARILSQSPDQPLDADVLLCSDDLMAAEQVVKLAQAAGMRGYYAGGLANAIVVESLTSLLISMNKFYKVRDASIRITGIEENQLKPMKPLILTPLPEIPMVHTGDDLAALIIKGLSLAGIEPKDGDILVIAQKIVSKAEDRWINLVSIQPTADANKVAEEIGKDPRLIQLILSESKQVLRKRTGTIIVEHRLGFICANAGIDHSNVAGEGDTGEDWVLLLPEDPDQSAQGIRQELVRKYRVQLGVLIIDSHGRAWRQGVVGVAIGFSGMPGLLDLRGRRDLFGYTLRVTTIGVADELAAAASLVMGQADEATPIVHVRGFPYPLREGRLQELIRPIDQDLFR